MLINFFDSKINFDFSLPYQRGMAVSLETNLSLNKPLNHWIIQLGSQSVNNFLFIQSTSKYQPMHLLLHPSIHAFACWSLSLLLYQSIHHFHH